MSVIVFRAGGNISTALNGVAAIASNLGTWSSTTLSLSSTPRTIAFTPAGVDTIQGAALAILANGSNSSATITCKLQQNIATVWTDVAGATKTLTASEYTCTESDNVPANNASSATVVEFAFGTPAAVTAASNTWRLSVTATVSSPLLMTSDGTNPFFVAIGSTASTYTDNTDQIVVLNSPLTIDANTTLKDAQATGDTVRGVCGVIGSSPTGGASPYMLLCTADSITMTTKGFLNFASYAGAKWDNGGTALTGCTINANAVTAGSGTTLAGWMSLGANSVVNSTNKGMYMYFNGTIPSIEDTYLIKDIAVGASSMEVADTTGWSNGDHIYMGGNTTKGAGDTTQYTVTSTSGTTINFSPVLAGSIRRCGFTGTLTIASPCVVTPTATAAAYHGLVEGDTIFFSTTGSLPTGITAGTKYYVISTGLTKTTFQFSDTLGGAAVNTSGSQSGTHTIAVTKYSGRVTRMNGYGIVIKSGVTGGSTWSQGQPYGWYFSGCQIQDIQFNQSSNNGPVGTYIPASWRSPYTFSHCSVEATTTPAQHSGYLAALSLDSDGAILDHVNFARMAVSGSTRSNGNDPFITMTNCIVTIPGFTGATAHFSILDAYIRANLSDNHFESGTTVSNYNFTGGLWERNRWYGMSTSNSAVRLTTVIDSIFNDDIFDNCTSGVALITTSVGNMFNRTIFGPTVANTTDVFLLTGYARATFTDIGSTLIYNTSAAGLITNTTQGSQLRFANYLTGDINNNLTVTKRYESQSTGTGLSDTTARTSGGYALRIKPTSGTSLSTWPLLTSERAIPTGNIQNKPMTVLGWVYINDTAYDAGTYTLPTLNIKYDNETTVTSVATATFGSWQLVSKTFTPTSTYGQIEVWWSMATDATGSNAYVYIDDMQVQYPSGSSLNLGSLDLYAGGLPVWPPIATNPFIGSAWDEQTSAHTDTGSFGKFVQKLLSVSKFLALK